MKWIALLIAAFAVVPLSAWLRRNPAEAPKVWMLIGFLPFVVYHLHFYMAFISWSTWGGYAKGMEITVIDVFVLALYLSLPGRAQATPFWISMVLYFVAALLSVIPAQFPMAALFYPWQLARMFLVYATVARGVSSDPRIASALTKGMAVALIMEACIVTVQRVGFGMLQTPGSFLHQNMLGVLTHFVVLPAFALYLAGRRDWFTVAVIISGIVVDLMTVSRATIGLAALGFAIVFALSALRRWTPQKGRVLLVGVVLSAVLVPAALISLSERSSNNNEAASDNERTAYSAAAAMMFEDHPFGVGANHFTLVANLGGYYSAAGVAAFDLARYQNVHNSYRLVACETGFLGLIALLFVLLRPLIAAFRCGWRNSGDIRGDWLLGLGVSLLIVYLHCFYEWIVVDYQFQYVLASQIGLVAGLALQLRYWRAPGSRLAGMRSTKYQAGAFGVDAAWGRKH
jgi:O-antigen ligase